MLFWANQVKVINILLQCPRYPGKCPLLGEAPRYVSQDHSNDEPNEKSYKYHDVDSLDPFSDSDKQRLHRTFRLNCAQVGSIYICSPHPLATSDHICSPHPLSNSTSSLVPTPLPLCEGGWARHYSTSRHWIMDPGGQVNRLAAGFSWSATERPMKLPWLTSCKADVKTTCPFYCLCSH